MFVCGVKKKKSESLRFESAYQYNERESMYSSVNKSANNNNNNTKKNKLPKKDLFSPFSPNALFTKIVTWSHEYSVVRDE